MSAVEPSRLPALLAAAALLVPIPSAAQAPPRADAWRDLGVCYEVFVRSFRDSDGDGIGDLAGLIEKLDYVNDGDPATGDDLGARCLWLMPIATSGSYHGYDVIDYYHVDPRYGTNDDFRRLVEEAGRRGVRVLVDLVINHVSWEHPYFRHALLHGDSPWRDWFRWSDSRGEPNEWGGYNWHGSPFADEYYYGFFWHGMPDLNWESPDVRDEMERVATFWLEEMGAGGFRLDAVRHLMEEGDRTANVPRTHDVLRAYASHVRAVAPDAYTIGEVFDSTDVLMAYYPDQLDAYFAFELANAILEAARTGSRGSLLEKVVELQEAVPAWRWGTFLRNHDQTRTLTWLDGDAARAKLAASLLLTLPGVPFVYYGEEIGMTGDKPDPRLRTPMHWSRGPAAGFTEGVPWEPLQADSLTANVEAMEEDPSSLLSLYRSLIHLRNGSAVLESGELVPLETGRDDVAAWIRRTEEGEAALVVANLGDAPLGRILLSSGAGALPPGRHRLRPLFGEGAPADALEVDTAGALRGAGVPAPPPLTVRVLELLPAGSPAGQSDHRSR